MELKEYQSRALEAFDRWREALEKARGESEAAIEAWPEAAGEIPSEVRDYPRAAWRKLAEAGGVADATVGYIARADEAERPIPHACFKVPTGGGKTLLAAAALERLNRPTGLTLWIVPSRAIYQQTKDALWNREHPYRQMLERASGGRVKMLEKDVPFTASDVANYLCVMLLMLPAANRMKAKEFLRMFRDSGRYPTLFPDGDDALADGRLLERYPDLARISVDGPVKHSLFNVFKMLRPVVVLDEAHKAYGKPKEAADFVQAVNRLDPSLVLELSATPHRKISNLLVDIGGPDLKQEEMIKLPVRVTSYTGADWRHTLEQAHSELERLDAEGRALQGAEGRYIRPIAVVRVERTGKDQRDGERVHAEDAREHLIVNLGVPADAIRVKSADKDELGREDLLSEVSPVRWIITKAALMEGWDCPFAYMLVLLDNTKTQTAITQLVGRVMRQPHVRRTEREALDQCYVYCWNTDVGVAVEQVKQGLENEGLTGLGDFVESRTVETKRLTVERRERFRGLDIFFPLVLHQDGEGWRDLDYQRHILARIDWDKIASHDPQASQPDKVRKETASVDVGETPTVFDAPEELYVDKTVEVSFFARRLSDIVPNPWQAARIAQELIKRLRAGGEDDETIYDRRSYLASALCEYVKGVVEKQAERVFRRKLRNGEIRFDLDAVDANYRMVDTYELPAGVDDVSLQKHGVPLQLSLFEPVLARQFDSDLERRFARYLDEQKALRWWHRVAVRQQHEYYLRGWRQERIYPDFIAMAGETAGKPHVLVFETKGEHLKGNPDTEYKKRVLETLEGAFNAGRMQVRDGPAKGTFRIVFNQDEFPAALANVNDTGVYKV